MAVKNITYNNKVALAQDPLVPLINQVTADDMNEVKEVVNSNATETSGMLDIISQMNDFKFDINTDVITVDMPVANTLYPITLEKGIYIVQSNPSPTANFNINTTGTTLWTRMAGTTITTSISCNFVSGAYLIYGSDNVFVISTTSSTSSFTYFYQHTIPITNIESIAVNEANAKLAFIKIKSFV